MNRFLAAAAAAILMGGAEIASAQVHSGDIILSIANGSIRTNGSDPSNGAIIPNVRMFKATLGTVLPDYTSNPGFDCVPGTFSVGSSNTFVILDAVRVWLGSTFDSVSASSFSIGLGPLGPVDSPSTPGDSVMGFWVPVSGNGEWHRHFDFTLNDPASTGIYLLQLKIINDSGVGESDRFYMVFNQNDTQAHQDQAAAYVQRVRITGRTGDLNFDGVVNSSDLALLLGSWGTTAFAPDLNFDGTVNSSDLALLLGGWGM